MQIRHIILDIDEMLATDFVSPTKMQDFKYISNCGNSKRFLQALRPHFLHHGVLEFIKVLFNIPNIQLYFFSSDTEERNVVFVKELLKHVFGEKDAHENFAKCKVYSKHHCTAIDPAVKRRKKNLTVISQDKIFLDNAILIDDNLNNICEGQEKNFLHVLPVYPEDIQLTDQSDDEYKKSELFKKTNHIFYAMGMLLKSFDLTNNISLTEALTKCKLESQNNIEIYMHGLMFLQKINADLKFLLPSTLTQQLQIKDNHSSSVTEIGLFANKNDTPEKLITSQQSMLQIN